MLLQPFISWINEINLLNQLIYQKDNNDLINYLKKQSFCTDIYKNNKN